MTITSTKNSNKIYLYDSDARFIKDQVSTGLSVSAAGVVHELIENYRRNNDAKEIQTEMQKEIAEISKKQRELQKMMSALDWNLSALTELSGDLNWQARRDRKPCWAMTREEFEKNFAALPTTNNELEKEKK